MGFVFFAAGRHLFGSRSIARLWNFCAVDDISCFGNVEYS